MGLSDARGWTVAGHGKRRQWREAQDLPPATWADPVRPAPHDPLDLTWPLCFIPRWTVQIRPFMVTAKAAIPSERSRPSQFYFTPFPVGKSACTFVRQLRGPHLSTCA
jgi:hypothetical protein